MTALTFRLFRKLKLTRKWRNPFGLPSSRPAAVHKPVSKASAADSARFVAGFLGIGLDPDSAVSLILPKLIGPGRVAEFAFGNQPINVEQALAWGLVNWVAPTNERRAEAAAWRTELAHGPIHAMRLAKRDFNKAILPNLEWCLTIGPTIP